MFIRFLKNSFYLCGLLLLFSACGRIGGNNTEEGLSAGASNNSETSCDSTTIGKIFQENPLVDSGNPSLAFNSDLGFYGTEVTIANLDGSCELKNEYVSVTTDGFFPGQIANVDPDLVFSPTDPRFQQVMAYYYSNDLMQRLLAIGLSLNSIGTVKIDAHCNLADQGSENNAYYFPSSNSNCFGYVNLGGATIWAADDADAVVHEVGHAVNHGLASTAIMNSSGEAGALDEAIADYWAHTINNNPGISPWFIGAIEAKFSISGEQRNATDNNLYPNTMVYNVHDDSRPFSEALYSIRNSIGQSKADKLVSNMLLLLPATTRYFEAVKALQTAASLIGLSSGERNTIDSILTSKGLIRSDSGVNLRLSTNGSHKQVYVMDDYRFTVQSGGNCNGNLDIGETALVMVNLENTGSIMGMGYFEISSDSSGATAINLVPNEYFKINANSDFVTTLKGSGVSSADATTVATFAVTASTPGAKNFTMTFTPMNGAPTNINFSLTVGTDGSSNNCINSSLWPAAAP